MAGFAVKVCKSTKCQKDAKAGKLTAWINQAKDAPKLKLFVKE
jgi:hypothetical protein